MFYPEALKKCSNWVLYKEDKIPYSAKYNGKARPNDYKTWSTFREAEKKLKQNPLDYKGLGFVFTKKAGFVFIDVDHCITENGEFSETALDIIDHTPDQYAEVSQSGTGLHIIMRGNIDKAIKYNGVEVYNNNRYCALTGNALRECEPHEDAEALNYILETYKKPEAPKKPTPHNTKSIASGKAKSTRLTDDEVINKCSAKGGIFNLLFFEGDITGAGYIKADGSGDNSLADAGLCTILAFWCDKNPAQIDRIFRRSALYRDKWERADYRESTIQGACDEVRETYSEFLERKSVEEQTALQSATEHTGLRSIITRKLKDLQPESNPLYNDKHDTALARLFADVFKDLARYNVDAKEWYFYDGKRWKKDTGSMRVEQYAKVWADALGRYSFTFNNEDYIKSIIGLQNRAKRKRIIEDARDFYFICMEDLDTEPYLLNCQNCVLDLRTGNTLEHSPDLMFSKVAGVNYVKGAESKDFLNFISQIMQGDSEKVDYLQRLFGYCLIGENTQEECYICYGATTRNGKSTLLDTVCKMFGDYAVDTPPETFAIKQNRDSSRPSPDLARLSGVRLLHLGEAPKRMLLDVALLKKFTGRDKITARHLNEGFFDYIPVAKVVMNTNHLPVVADDTLFCSGRAKVITFEKHFEPEEQDVHLKERLQSPANLSGLLNWCLEGLQRFQSQGDRLTPPKAVQEATEQYRHDSDKIQLYIDERLEKRDGAVSTMKDVYDDFKIWCDRNGFCADSKSSLKQDFIIRNMFADTATVNGSGRHNVVKGFVLRSTVFDTE